MTSTITLNITDLTIGNEETEKMIIDGEFLEGKYVTVRIDGKEYTRKVKYSGKWGDLIITVKGMEYGLCEFNYQY